MSRKPRNLAASVRQRLTDLARRRGEDFQLVLTHYAVERLLYRLSRSPYQGDFVLKGAMLFPLWTDQPHRPTRDVDLLGKGDPSPDRLVRVFQAVCGSAVEDDGLMFDTESIRAERIKEDAEYEGVRVHCNVRLGQARIDLQIDVGFGDAIVPAAVEVEYPTLLTLSAPRLLAYPKETVVAEKFQALTVLGLANSRMKDFFDLWVLAHELPFEGVTLAGAIHATFLRRRTELPKGPPLALTSEFGTDALKIRQWQAFVGKGKLNVDRASLEQVCCFLAGFLMPPVDALVAGQQFEYDWPPAGPWRQSSPQR